MKVVITGASGKAGRAVVGDLIEHQQDVLGVDLVSPSESPAAFLLADLTDFGQALECLAGAEAVVHPAAIPARGIHTEETTFRATWAISPRGPGATASPNGLTRSVMGAVASE